MASRYAISMIGGPPPIRILIIGALLHLVAGLLGVRLARFRPDYLPVAVFLAGTAIVDLVLVALTVGAPTEIPASPLTGMARVVGQLREALWLIWPFAFVAMFLAIFAGRRPWAVGAAYVVTIAVLVIEYPTLRGEVLRRVYFGIELAALIIAAGALIQWAWRREFPLLPHLVAIGLLSTEVAVLLGPWAHDIFAGWTAGRIMYSMVYAAISIVTGGMLWIRRSHSS